MAIVILQFLSDSSTISVISDSDSVLLVLFLVLAFFSEFFITCLLSCVKQVENKVGKVYG